MDWEDGNSRSELILLPQEPGNHGKHCFQESGPQKGPREGHAHKAQNPTGFVHEQSSEVLQESGLTLFSLPLVPKPQPIPSFLIKSNITQFTFWEILLGV